MDERLEDFAGLLRQNGLRISPAEVADAAKAALLVGLEDRASLHGALRATLVKRGQDAPVFDRLFELYFTGAKDLIEGLQVELASRRISRTLQALEETGRRIAEREQKARDREARGDQSLLHRNLASLTPDEVERMRAVVRRLAER